MYNPKRVQVGFDISLLRLDQEVSFTNHIKAACLPDNNSLYPSLKSAGAIAGWGRTNGNTPTSASNLQNAKVYVADKATDERCRYDNESIMCLGFYFHFVF